MLQVALARAAARLLADATTACTTTAAAADAVARAAGDARPARAAELEHVPVEDVVVGEPLPVEQVAEQLTQVRVVRLILEPRRAMAGQ